MEAARKILEIQDETMRELNAMQKSSTIRLASSSVWGTKIIEEIIPKFHKKYPEVFLNITAQVEMYYLESEIQKGNLDFALISLSPFDHLDSNMHLLREEVMFLTVPAEHPYCRYNPGDVMPLGDIAEYFSEDTFLISRPGSSIRTTVERVFENLSFVPKRVFEVNGLYLTVAMVAEEEGAAFIPQEAAYDNPKIHYYRTDPVLYRYNILFSKPLNNYSETEQTFYRYILSYFKDKNRRA